MTFFEDCDGIDGPLAGWQFGDTSRRLEVVGNRCSTNRDTARYAGAALHGLVLSGDFEIAARITAPKITSDGGVNVWLLNAAGDGWGFFVGNAVHIQKITAFTHANVTNVGVPGEATAGTRQSVIRLTRDGATGLISAYLDGEPWGHVTDTDHLDVGPQVVVFLRNVRSPQYETSIDDLLVTSKIRS